MTTTEIANRLYELCQQGKFDIAENELYAATATSTESDHQGGRKTLTGIEAIKAAGEEFKNSIQEMHGGYTNEPRVFGNYIFMEMGMDVTMKGMERMKMDEMCVYEVKEGKIISAEFFY